MSTAMCEQNFDHNIDKKEPALATKILSKINLDEDFHLNDLALMLHN